MSQPAIGPLVQHLFKLGHNTQNVNNVHDNIKVLITIAELSCAKMRYAPTVDNDIEWYRNMYEKENFEQTRYI